MPDQDSEEIRLDIWLWRARFFRTRSLASDHVSRKGVRLTRHGQTRKTDKPGTRIQPGDVLTFYKAKDIQTIEMLEPGTRRGPASEAAALYRSIAPDP
ncbi:MAG: RNA-binding S4 domain-containing protein [Henriciella sp.]|nr:RNA-binding S4 domain-containing protein [Henriciella sp.]